LRDTKRVTKQRVENYQSLDSGELYDARIYPFEEGEEPFIHGCKMKLYPSYGLFSLPFQEKFSYRISVDSTLCNYGGERHWFLCPFPGCAQRSKKLYLHPEGVFICRKCLGLAYMSQNCCELTRLINKKWNLIHKMGAESEFLTHKPKGMHETTFSKIQEEIYTLDRIATQLLFERFGQCG